MKNRPNSLAVRAVFHIPKNAVLHAKLPKTGKNGAHNSKKTAKTTRQIPEKRHSRLRETTIESNNVK